MKVISQHHHVTVVDVIPEKVEKLNNKISTIQDDYIEKYLAEKPLNLVVNLDGKEAYKDADFEVIAASICIGVGHFNVYNIYAEVKECA